MMTRIDKKWLIALLVFQSLYFGLFDGFSPKGALFGADTIRNFLFTGLDVLKGWEEKIHTQQIKLKPATVAGDRVIEISSSDAASGYFFKFEKPWDPNLTPYSSFIWRVDELPAKEAPASMREEENYVQFASRRGGGGRGDRGEEASEGVEVSAKDQDDYFRIYFITDAFSIAFAKCLEYVWDVHRGPMARLRSPWSDSIRLLVLENKKSFGQWRKETRNVVEDFKMAFGKSAWDKNIAAVAFMVDTDNTHGKAKAYLKEMKIGMKAKGGEASNKSQPLYHLVWKEK